MTETEGNVKSTRSSEEDGNRPVERGAHWFYNYVPVVFELVVPAIGDSRKRGEEDKGARVAITVRLTSPTT